MRILFFSVSDALGGSEIALVDMIASLRRLRPSWHLGLVLPGTGPLLRRAEAAGADCTMLAMPAALARVGEFASGSSRWPLAAKAVLAVRLAPVAMSLPGYLRRLRTVVRGYQPAILHTNGFKAHVLGARARGGAKVVWHMHEYVGDRALTRALLERARRGARPRSSPTPRASPPTSDRRCPKPSRREVVYNAVDLTTFAADGPADDLD